MKASKKIKTPATTGDASDRIFGGVMTPLAGFVDFYGFVSGAGWFFCGWIGRPPSTQANNSVPCTAQFGGAKIVGKATVSYFPRADLAARGIGVVVYLRAPRGQHQVLQQIALEIDRHKYLANAAQTALPLPEAELRERLRPILNDSALADESRAYLLRLTSRPTYVGADTLATLSEPILLHIDDAILCPPGGVLLTGWQISGREAGYTFRLRSGHLSTEFSLDQGIRAARQDVVDAVGDQADASDLQCGFLVYVPDSIVFGEETYIEVESKSGRIGFKPFRLSKRKGMGAIQRIFEMVLVRYHQVDPAFDKVLGPAISALNVQRLSDRGKVDEIVFGTVPKNPRASVIIPLYGRIDFVEYQMALFSRIDAYRDVEIIYVLDDPPKRRQLESLCSSLHARFANPFRVLLHSKNMGFAAANNSGLAVAAGEYICYLNSDVFPGTDDWLDRQIRILEQNPRVGIVGPRLLFEDGSVQHEGCVHKPIPELGGWLFLDHSRKGLLPDQRTGLHDCEVITGACMVMSRKLTDKIGGFDEAFVVGDFEDADLCKKAQQQGLSCAVDFDTHLYHLERKSQAAPSQLWRMNMTLFNAWLYQRRWISPAGVALASGDAKRRKAAATVRARK